MLSELVAVGAAQPIHAATLLDGDLDDRLFPCSVEPLDLVQSNISYERLTDVGYDQARGLVAATFAVRHDVTLLAEQPAETAHEHVRFFVDRGAGWVDVGMISIDLRTVLDPVLGPVDATGGGSDATTHRVELPVCPHRGPISVRAILSYDSEPPAGSPDWRPVWGDVRDRRQVGR